jgi:iron complex outermembrane receptor protein
MRIEHSRDRIERRRNVSFEPPSAFQSTRNEWNAQPKVRLDYHWSERDLAYLSSAFGYKNGGFSFLETDPRFAAFETERAWTNEIGIRKSWAAGRFESRAALFFNRIENYQVERIAVPPDITVFNAPLVTSWGAEIEATARPLKGFELTGAFGYTHSEFREFRDPITGENFRGKRTPFAPEITASLRMRYKSAAGFFGQAELLASGETSYDEANTAFLRQAAHGQVNLKVGYENARFSVNAYCDNLNDARYFTQKIGYAGIGTPGAPRSVGAVLVIKL